MNSKLRKQPNETKRPCSSKSNSSTYSYNYSYKYISRSFSTYLVLFLLIPSIILIYTNRVSQTKTLAFLSPSKNTSHRPKMEKFSIFLALVASKRMHTFVYVFISCSSFGNVTWVVLSASIDNIRSLRRYNARELSPRRLL